VTPSGKKLLVIVVVALLVAALGVAALELGSDEGSPDASTPLGEGQPPQSGVQPRRGDLSDAARKIGASPKCTGTGPVELAALPMREEDFALVLPYGLMVGAHVTPIDHWYFSPADRKSPRDAYEVYAMADGILSQIQRRRIKVDTGEARPEEFRLVFTHTCTFLTYYDLVTSLDKAILDQVPELQSKDNVNPEIAVKKGQRIGYIGGQTLDFAVWDLEKPLKGFVNLESYSAGDPWKPYTANPYDYVSPAIRRLLIDRNPRTVEPIQGKIDYDIDGRIVGNWFLEGTNGYLGKEQSRYWVGHLALAYSYLDPSAIVISVGDWAGREGQFTVRGNAPDPAAVGVSDAPTKYELVWFNYVDQNGRAWDGASLVKNLKAAPMEQIQGTILVQLVENRRLKAEAFPGKAAAQVSGFTEQARIYVR